ncbi:hypothetical protein BDV59DRAFT_116042 [Aspergillus ambiguus]|uniref:uncharacterized protein n=1 Tax=Aspergillus ambiguus TaxID=176160 RepID=UPI003CCE3EAF
MISSTRFFHTSQRQPFYIVSPSLVSMVLAFSMLNCVCHRRKINGYSHVENNTHLRGHCRYLSGSNYGLESHLTKVQYVLLTPRRFV